MAEPTSPSRRAGFALLIVLWVLVLIALILSQLFSLGRTGARVADGLQESAKAEAAADGAVYETIFRLIQNGRRLQENGERKLAVDDGNAVIRVIPEDGKINPNTATPQILTALLAAVGVEGAQAMRLASAIADWRDTGDRPRPLGAKLRQYVAAQLGHAPPNAPFESLDELGRVLGMTPAILAVLRPHLTLYSLSEPDPRLADPLVAQVLRPFAKTLAHQTDAVSLVTVTIQAEARLTSGVTFKRSAIVRFSQSFARGYAILGWNQGG